jgi:hypothetical protein
MNLKFCGTEDRRAVIPTKVRGSKQKRRKKREEKDKNRAGERREMSVALDVENRRKRERLLGDTWCGKQTEKLLLKRRTEKERGFLCDSWCEKQIV